MLVCRPPCSCGHLCTCSYAWLLHLEKFPLFICPDVLTLYSLGCVSTRAHSLLGHVHPHSLWHACVHVHMGVTQNASPVPLTSRSRPCPCPE